MIRLPLDARRVVGLLGALALGLVAAALPAVPAPAAAASPSVSVTVADRPGLSRVADSRYLTEVRLHGTGFQSIQNGFGGIYVLFGWADGSWRPSQGGQTGTDYRYVYDDESAPVGYQLFVSFPGSSTEYAANGGEIAADGTWSATLKIPGPKFQAYDRSGGISDVDCLQVQCGVITIGAHGVVNPNNETFTPISFKEIYDSGEGRQVVSQAPREVAVAPQVIGGRPATVPTARDEAELDAAPSGGVEATPGTTRLTVTVPGASADAWLGVALYSDPRFVGWLKPNSHGVLDVDVPADLAPGTHRVVVVDDHDDLIGWSEFEWSSTADPTPSSTPDAAASALEPAGPSTALVATVIAVAAAVLAAFILLGVAIVRTRRRAAAPTPHDDPKDRTR